MKVCIYGAGAIGGHLVARLYKAGVAVSVIARGAHLAAIQANGLTVHAVDGQHHAPVRASTDPAELGSQDAVFVTVKAPALPAVAASIKPLLDPDTPAAFVMNEATAVAQALGADPTADHERRIAGPRSMDHKPSILQDIELGRPVEIDGMFDAPLALAHLAGIQVPTLELLVALCKPRARTAGLYN